MPKISGAGQTHVGLKRKNNEDAFFYDEDLGLFIVADGMGGAASGEIASRMVVDTISDYIMRYSDKPLTDRNRYGFYDKSLTVRANTFLQSIHLANRLIYDAASREKKHKGMGATLAAVLTDDEGVLVVNVGDSPVFRSRDRKLEQITVEHRFSDDPKFKDLVDPEATIMTSIGNTLTRAMGVKEIVEPDLYWVKVEPNDILMMCSDGLTDMVDKETIARLLAMDRGIDQKVKDLIELALAGGGRDNVTVVLAEVQPEGKFRALFKKVKRT